MQADERVRRHVYALRLGGSVMLEQQTKLTKNQWLIAGTATFGGMLDFFDFGLTFGEAGLILLASGISAPFGSLRRRGRPSVHI
jgi:hypothetical protein